MVIATTPQHLFTYKSLQVSKFILNKGEGLPKHEHKFNHLTMCVFGSCIVRKENFEVILRSNDNAIDLIANQWHEIESLEDNTVILNIE